MKKQRQKARGFAEQPPLSTEITSSGIEFDRLLAGEVILVCGRVQDAEGYGGDLLFSIPMDQIEKPSVQLAYDMACTNYKLGVRRQLEQGRGLLSLMDSEYRAAHGIYDSDGAPVVFNWFTTNELKQVARSSVLFNNTNSLRLFTSLLTERCDRNHEFPVLWNGVPMVEDPENRLNGRVNLLFVINGRSKPSQQLNMQIAAEKFL